MASTFLANARLVMGVIETLGGDDVPSGSTVPHTGYDEVLTLNASSTPAIDSAAFEDVTLTAGAATLDLTVLLLNAGSVSLSGKKPEIVIFRNDSTHAITVAKGASNGYTGFGSSFSIAIPAGGAVMLFLNGNAAAVSGSVKTLDLTGTGSDVLKVGFAAGT